jgi:hypothetical protein
VKFEYKSIRGEEEEEEKERTTDAVTVSDGNA